MRRGTTPTLTFILPFSTEGMDVLKLNFSQNNKIVFQKTLKDVTLDGYSVYLTLTQEETLKLSSRQGSLDIQMRCGYGETRLASNIITVEVEKLLKDGAI